MLSKVPCKLLLTELDFIIADGSLPFQAIFSLPDIFVSFIAEAAGVSLVKIAM